MPQGQASLSDIDAPQGTAAANLSDVTSASAAPTAQWSSLTPAQQAALVAERRANPTAEELAAKASIPGILGRWGLTNLNMPSGGDVWNAFMHTSEGAQSTTSTPIKDAAMRDAAFIMGRPQPAEAPQQPQAVIAQPGDVAIGGPTNITGPRWLNPSGQPLQMPQMPMLSDAVNLGLKVLGPLGSSAPNVNRTTAGTAAQILKSAPAYQVAQAAGPAVVQAAKTYGPPLIKEAAKQAAKGAGLGLGYEILKRFGIIP